MTNNPRLLTIDIETSPALSYHWGLWQQNISLAQIVEPSRVICYAYQWYGERKRVEFDAEWKHRSRDAFLGQLYDLWTEADGLIHWNGESFDEPHIRREFLTHGFKPAKPIQSIDLMRHVKRNYRFLSNKLDYVSGELIGQHKVGHEGFGLWRRVLDGDPVARKTMERYNKRDVALTTAVAKELKPHIPKWPHAGLYTGQEFSCVCGSTDLEKRGTKTASSRVYQQYHCNSCGRWPRGTQSIGKVTVVGG